MKKIIASLLMLSVLIALTGCSHMHTIDTWSVDYYKHWHVCTECGEKIDATEHDFNKKGICIVCNSFVEVSENGNIVVTVYDSEGKAVREIVFNAEGTIIGDTATQ